MTTIDADALSTNFPRGWFTAEEFRRTRNPKWPPAALRHALRTLADDGTLETRVDEQAMVREYRAVK